MNLIGGRGQPIRTSDGVIHLVTQHHRGGFLNQTACGISWRRENGAAYAAEGTEISCMTCLVHEERS